MVFRDGVGVEFCSSILVRGRFNDGADVFLTRGVVEDDREVIFEKGLSDVEVCVAAGLMLIFGRAVSSFSRFAGVGTWEDEAEDEAEEGIEVDISVSALCSGLGFAGPASFSIRRRRIYKSCKLKGWSA